VSSRRSRLIRESGPYRVESCADGTLRVEPDWPQFPKYTDEEGGGPGLFSRMNLAGDIERFLNGGVYHRGRKT
jgi:hypothetical protein